jgi:hypothetical protein
LHRRDNRLAALGTGDHAAQVVGQQALVGDLDRPTQALGVVSGDGWDLGEHTEAVVPEPRRETELDESLRGAEHRGVAPELAIGSPGPESEGSGQVDEVDRNAMGVLGEELAKSAQEEHRGRPEH